MAGGDRPPDWTETVRANHSDAVAWVVAESEPCLNVRDQEVERIDRVLRAADLASLPESGDLPDSWLLAYILCPGDEVDTLLDWVETLEPTDRERVQIYHHPEADLVDLLDAWFERGFPELISYEVSDFREFHKVFGWEFNDQVYRDATGWTPPS